VTCGNSDSNNGNYNGNSGINVKNGKRQKLSPAGLLLVDNGGDGNCDIDDGNNGNDGNDNGNGGNDVKKYKSQKLSPASLLLPDGWLVAWYKLELGLRRLL